MSDKDPLAIAGLTVADKYKIERLVGEGGFAVVYRAQHTIWNKPVAIKFFNGLSSAPAADRAELQQAFINEGALLTELSSQTASIVQARDIGSFTSPDGQWLPFMVLEWLEGRPLEDVLEGERQAGLPTWSLTDVVRVLAPVAGALEVAHRKGIAHRDIKPANIFVLGTDARGADVQVKLLDFGVAKMMSDNTHMKAAMAKTGANITSFTPQYGAPEQFSRSYGATGPWTDVYALALVAVEMLTGRHALDGHDLVQLAFASSNPDKRPTPAYFGLDLGPAEAVFQRALAVDPKLRPESAGQFWQELQQVAGVSAMGATFMASPASLAGAMQSGASAARLAPTVAASTVPLTQTASPTAVTGSQGGGGKGGLVVGALAAVAVLGGGAFFFLGGDKPTAAPAAATSAAPVAAASSAAAVPAAPTCPDDMVLIRGGQYFMGSDAADARENEKPAHNVKLSSYCIDRDEVTSGKYKDCSDVGKCKRAPVEVDWPNITPADKKTFSPLCTGGDVARADHPINCIDWEMARTYCDVQGKRLPTEAEWEYATRGPDGRVFPWGDDAPTAKHLNACGTECVKWGQANGQVMQALYPADDGWPGTAPVGSFPTGSSRFGPRDVVGNVWEWVSDWDGKYGGESVENPTGSPTGERRIIRGGAFNGWFKDWLRPSYRYAQVPTARSHGIGVRCAKGAGG